MMQTQGIISNMSSNIEATSAPTLADNELKTKIGTIPSKRSPSGYNLFFHMVRDDILLFHKNNAAVHGDNTSRKHPIFSEIEGDFLKYMTHHFHSKQIEVSAIRLRTKPKRKHVKVDSFPISFRALTHIVSKQWQHLIPSVKQMFLSQATSEAEHYHEQQPTPSAYRRRCRQKQQSQNGNKQSGVVKATTKMTNEKQLNDLSTKTNDQEKNKTLKSNLVNETTKSNNSNIDLNQLDPINDNLQLQLLVQAPQLQQRLPQQLSLKRLPSQCNELQQQLLQEDIMEQEIFNHDLKQNSIYAIPKFQSTIMNDEIIHDFNQEINHHHSIKNTMNLDAVGNDISFLIDNNNMNVLDESMLYNNSFDDLCFNPMLEDELKLEDCSFGYQNGINGKMLTMKTNHEHDCINRTINTLHDDDRKEISFRSFNNVVSSDCSITSSYHNYCNKIMQNNNQSYKMNINKDATTTNNNGNHRNNTQLIQQNNMMMMRKLKLQQQQAMMNDHMIQHKKIMKKMQYNQQKMMNDHYIGNTNCNITIGNNNSKHHNHSEIVISQQQSHNNNNQLLYYNMHKMQKIQQLSQQNRRKMMMLQIHKQKQQQQQLLQQQIAAQQQQESFIFES